MSDPHDSSWDQQLELFNDIWQVVSYVSERDCYEFIARKTAELLPDVLVGVNRVDETNQYVETVTVLGPKEQRKNLCKVLGEDFSGYAQELQRYEKYMPALFSGKLTVYQDALELIFPSARAASRKARLPFPLVYMIGLCHSGSLYGSVFFLANDSRSIESAREGVSLLAGAFSLVLNQRDTERQRYEEQVYSNARRKMFQLGMAAGDTAELVRDVFILVGQTVKPSRISLSRLHDDGRSYNDLSLEWVAPGASPSVPGTFLPPSFLDLIKKNRYTCFTPHTVKAFLEGRFPHRDVRLLHKQIIELMRLENISDIIIFPLVVNGSFRGFISYDWCRDERREWSVRDRTIGLDMAEIIAVNIARMEAEAQVAAQNRFNELRAAMWRGAARSEILAEEKIQTVLDRLGPAIKASRLSYVEMTPRGNGLLVRQQWAREDVPSTAGKIMPGDAVKSYLSGGGMIVVPDDIRPSIRRLLINGLLKRYGMKKMLLVPFRKHGKLTGYICIEERDNGDRVWSEAERNLLLEVSHIVSASIQTAETEMKGEERFRNMAEIMPDGVCVFDLEGHIQYLNANGARQFHITVETAKQARIFDYILPADFERASAHLKDILKEGRHGIAEYQLIRPDGSDFLAEVTTALRVDNTDQPVGFQSYVRNISARKRLETEQRKAQNLNSLGVLAGGIAHDFNNALTGIIGMIEVAKADLPEGTNALQYLKKAENAAFNTTRLTNQLLTFSKGGAPVRETASINEVIQEAAWFTASGSKSVPRFKLADGLLPVSIDKGQIFQVIQNLVLNADQAMESGGTITIVSKNDELDGGNPYQLTPGRYIRIIISDEGHGISEENLKQIFTPYFTTKKGRKESGHGLGLATCYSIISKHEGRIYAQSVVGQGTSFHLLLPTSREALADGDPLSAAGRPREVNGSGRVLIMDDQMVILETARIILGEVGCDVDAVADGGEALRCYRQSLDDGSPYQVVILDLTVPGGMGGQETVEKLRELDPQVCAVVSSGYSSDPAFANYEKYGFAAALPKPYRRDELIRLIDKLMPHTVS